MSAATVPQIDTTSSSPTSWAALSVVVPCFNELESLDQLATGLERLRAALGSECRLEVLLIDDGSTDGTVPRMHELFDRMEGVRIVEHDHNRGIAAAINTGLRLAAEDAVATLDADCTYDPVLLVEMLNLLTDGVDMVVASPYHPQGRVEGVPGWRLGLSRAASRLYGFVLHSQLATYTSCVRVCRRASVANLQVDNAGFVGIVELLWQLDRRGGTIVECPAVLKVRTTGQSKMRVARAIAAHLRLLTRAASFRLTASVRRVQHQTSPAIS